MADHPLPTAVDTAVIGAGVWGLTAAWRLAAAGATVALVDDGGEPTAAVAAGMLCPWSEHEDDGERDFYTALRFAAAAWPTFAAEVEAAAGLPSGFHRCGSVYVAARPGAPRRRAPGARHPGAQRPARGLAGRRRAGCASSPGSARPSPAASPSTTSTRPIRAVLVDRAARRRARRRRRVRGRHRRDRAGRRPGRWRDHRRGRRRERRRPRGRASLADECRCGR